MAHLREKNGNFYAEFYSRERKPQRKWVALKVSDKQAARITLRELERKHAAGVYDPWYQRSVVSVPNANGALETFLSRKSNHNTRRSYKQAIERFLSECDVTTLSDITSDTIESFLEVRKSVTADMYYRHLRGFLNWCYKKRLIPFNPIEEVELSDLPTERMPKVVTFEQMQSICAKAYDLNVVSKDHIWAVPPIQFAFYSGFRLSEVCRLKWDDIDFTKKVIFIAKQKNRKQEFAPLTAGAEAVIRRMPRESEYVFPTPRKKEMMDYHRLSRKFTYLRTKANLPDGLTFHGLRHGFCTFLAEQGVSPLTIKDAARHKNIKTTMIYVDMQKNIVRDQLNDAFAKLGNSVCTDTESTTTEPKSEQ